LNIDWGRNIQIADQFYAAEMADISISTRNDLGLHLLKESYGCAETNRGVPIHKEERCQSGRYAMDEIHAWD
jgi:hypothetical protein